MSEPQMVDVTLRIDRRNLAALLKGRVPSAYTWIEDNGDGTYALCGSVPLGAEITSGQVNNDPESLFASITEDQKADLARKWEATPGAWGDAVVKALKSLR